MAHENLLARKSALGRRGVLVRSGRWIAGAARRGGAGDVAAGTGLLARGLEADRRHIRRLIERVALVDLGQALRTPRLVGRQEHADDAGAIGAVTAHDVRSEEHTSELQSRENL